MANEYETGPNGEQLQVRYQVTELSSATLTADRNYISKINGCEYIFDIPTAAGLAASFELGLMAPGTSALVVNGVELAADYRIPDSVNGPGPSGFFAAERIVQSPT